jgi:hypothetical protein
VAIHPYEGLAKSGYKSDLSSTPFNHPLYISGYLMEANIAI